MNRIRELMETKAIQQKELAIIIGVKQPTISDWVNNKKNPRGENLRKLAEYFEVSEDYVLGKGASDQVFNISQSFTDPEKLISSVLERLNDQLPRTPEARLISGAIDKMPKNQRERALDVMRVVFAEYATEFEVKGTETDET